MLKATRDIIEAAMLLPEGEREIIVTRLLESLPVDVESIALDDPNLVEELDRRFADREGTVAWEELRDKL